MFKFFKTFVMVGMIVISMATSALSAPKDVDVYVIRGLLGFLFQSGVYTINDDLKEKGYNVTFTCWQLTCEDKIVETIMANPKRKFAIVGHSMGGNAITQIGQRLAVKGIKIPYAAVIDAPIPQKLSTSFYRVDNFYQFNDWRDPILVTEKPKQNIDLKQFNYIKKFNHIKIAEAPVVRNRIYDQIEKLSR